MDHRITHASRCKICLRLLAWLRARLARIGERAFAATDGFAREQGWQITSTHAGLGRRYRDPRFDSLAPCSRCRGRGTTAPGDLCQTCNGTGRIVLDQTANLPPRRSA
jgi:DnaJ-class molecular chaperone